MQTFRLSVALTAYLRELDERHVVVEQKVLEHLRAAHLGRYFSVSEDRSGA